VLFNKNNIIPATGVLIAIFVFTAVFVVRALRSAPDPAEKEPEEILAFIASKEFSELTPEKKKEFLSELKEKKGKGPGIPFREMRKMPEQVRGNIMKNLRPLFKRHMGDRIKKYMSLKTKEEKDRFLDEMIDRHEKMRERMEKSGRGRKRHHDASRFKRHMKNIIENSTPSERASATQMMRDMRARREARQAN
jgi:hypothetical protein